MIERELEKTIIEHGLQLTRIETLMGSIQKSIDKMDFQKDKDADFRMKCQEINSKKFVGIKVFYSLMTIISSCIGFIISKII